MKVKSLKTARVSLRITKDEKERLRRQSERYGMTMTAWIVRHIEDDFPPRAYQELIRDLRRK